jgi:hypothetical protein
LRRLRTVIESELQYFNSREIFNIKYGSNRYEFLVDDLKPEKAVCVIDIDTEVDIEPIEQGTTLAREQTTSILVSS